MNNYPFKERRLLLVLDIVNGLLDVDLAHEVLVDPVERRDVTPPTSQHHVSAISSVIKPGNEERDKICFNSLFSGSSFVLVWPELREVELEALLGGLDVDGVPDLRLRHPTRELVDVVALEETLALPVEEELGAAGELLGELDLDLPPLHLLLTELGLDLLLG